MTTGWRQRLGAGAPLFPLAVLLTLQLIDQGIQAAFGVLIPNIRDSFGLTNAGILTIVAVAGAAALLFTVPVALLADRRPRVAIALIGGAVGALFAVGVGVAWTAVLLAVMLSGVTMGQAVIFPTHNSLLADYYPVETRTRIYSTYRSGASVGAIVGVLAGAGLAHAFSWRVPFVVFAVPLLITVVIGLRLREPARGRHELESLTGTVAAGSGATASELPPEPPPSFGEAWRLVWKIGVLRRTFGALPFLAASIVGFTSLASLQYQQTFHLGVVERGFIIAPVQLFDLAGLAVGAVVGTRLAARSHRLVFRLLAGAAFVAAAFAVLFALAPDVWVAFLANGGIDASLAVVGPGVLAALSLAIPARARSIGFSIGALFVLPGLVVIPIVGAVGDAVGLRWGMLVLVPVFIIGGVILASGGSLVEADIRNVWTSMHARAAMAEERVQGRLPLLSVHDLSVGYDGVAVLSGVDFEVREHEIVAVLGTNGAGKSTLLRAIGGVTEADAGAVVFDGRDITHAPPDEIARMGVAQMPGGEGVFPALTVEENLRAAAWQLRGSRHEAAGRIDRAMEDLPLLSGRRHSRACDLSGGQQQQLALAMALLTEPKLLIIDELSLGLAPIVVEALLESVRALRDRGTAVVLVEQSVNVALSVAERAYIFDGGRVRFEGTADEVAARPDLLWSIYLERAAAAGAPRSPGGDTGAAVDAATTVMAPAAIPLPDRESALRVRGLSVAFGGISALDEVDLVVAEGDVVGIIGPNGAGKTTLFDVISGFVRPDYGQILLSGSDLTACSAAARARLGVGRSFQDSRLFGPMSVRETLAVAFDRFVDAADPLNAVLRLPAEQRTEAAVAERVDELIDQFGLTRYADRLLDHLSTGTRRLVDLAAVLAHHPTVVLLDEPTSGIAQREVEAMADLLRNVRERLGATMVIVEHDIAFVAGLSDRLVALDRGRVLAEGPPDEVLSLPEVGVAFLGTDTVVRSRSGPRPAPAPRDDAAFTGGPS